MDEVEAEEWASAELRRLLAAEGIDTAWLTPLCGASMRFGTSCDWLLELDLAADRDAETCLESPPWREWLGDLRLLNLRPAAMVADHGRLLSVERG